MRSAVSAVMIVLATAASAAAQERHGFWFNGGLGYGSLGCDNCDAREGGLSGGLSLGGTIGPKFLLGIGTTGWTKSESGVTLTTGTLDARMRFYPSRTGGFFLTGGVGVGTIHASISGLGSGTETGVGVMLGLGYDIRVGDNLSLTPFWNGFAVRNDNSDANVGQLGLSLTVHRFRQPDHAVAPSAAPAQTMPPREPVPTLAPASAAGPAPTPTVDPQPEPAPETPDVGRTRLPAGTTFVGDTRLKVYYSIGCAAQHAIPPQFQVFFQSASGAVLDGFKASGDC